MATITIKQHDTKIVFRDTPTIDGVAVPVGDFAGCTLKFLMKYRGVVISHAAVITGAGLFEYEPVPTDVENLGDWLQEWEVTFPSTKILTFPNGGYNTVKIIADLG